MSECPTCRREFEDVSKPLTTVAVSIRARIAPGDTVLRSHITDMVQQAVLAWMHEDTYTSIEPTDEMVDLLDIVIAR
jgi:hypothetical protein